MRGKERHKKNAKNKLANFHLKCPLVLGTSFIKMPEMETQIKQPCFGIAIGFI